MNFTPETSILKNFPLCGGYAEEYYLKGDAKQYRLHLAHSGDYGSDKNWFVIIFPSSSCLGYKSEHPRVHHVQSSFARSPFILLDQRNRPRARGQLEVDGWKWIWVRTVFKSTRVMRQEMDGTIKIADSIEDVCAAEE